MLLQLHLTLLKHYTSPSLITYQTIHQKSENALLNTLIAIAISVPL